MKKPDRFDRLSESVCEEYRTGQCLIRDILKKKFKAQHAAYVRLVEKVEQADVPGMQTFDEGLGYSRACKDILDALELYKKGKP